MKYKRILLKLSGEALLGKNSYGIDNDRLVEYAEEIKQMLIELRNNPLQTIAGETVVKVEDYANSTSLNLDTKKRQS